MTSLLPTADAALRSSSFSIPYSLPSQLDRSYGAQALARPQSAASEAAEFGSTPLAHQPSYPTYSSPLSPPARQYHARSNEEWDAGPRGSQPIDPPAMNRSNSTASQGEAPLPMPARSGTLKKKGTLKRKSSLGRINSKRSSRAGSVRSLVLQSDADEANSAFFSPVPTLGNPTEILADRFAAWRKVLKDLITYFREVQSQYDHRSKNLAKLSNVINNTTTPAIFLGSGGIDDALQILRNYHRLSIAEANKSKMIEEDVILALTGLRSDLQQKIKEIKNLSGDFKNSVEKEMDATRRAVQQLGEALGHSEIDTAQMTGKMDPYLLKLQVDRQVEKQIDEENYLHQAYLNLEASGRELEAIVVGEIQKSYNAYAGILKREADEAYNAVDNLRTGPVAMPKDLEWDAFLEKDDNFIDPKVPVRSAHNIHYPGHDHENASEVRAGLLERKSKYLKSYTAGWYVLSPTHLHEFKSSDKLQAPIMSLYLPEQKLGSHSAEGGSSNKFMLKGRQTGALHRGHSWVFRAESHDTMMAWFEDIRTLTEKSPQERSDFVRRHARTVSGSSTKAGSVSSDGAMDEEDEEPFSGSASEVVSQPLRQDVLPKRPAAGGRFPSELQVNAERGLYVPLSPSSGSSGLVDTQDRDLIAAAASLPGSGVGEHFPPQRRNSHYGLDSRGEMRPSNTSKVNEYAMEDGVNPYTNAPIERHDAFDYMASGANDTAFGVAATEAYHGRQTAAFLARQAERAPEVASVQHHEVLPLPPSTMERTHLERLAAMESSAVAAPDVNHSMNPKSKSEGDVAPAMPASMPIITPATVAVAKEDEIKKAVVEPETDSGSLESGATSTPPATDVGPSLVDTSRAGQHNASIASIESVSQLHVPGGYPKATPTEEDALSFLT